MTAPQRIQLRRTKGWRLPEGAVVVARPTRWGNPFVVGESVVRDSELWPYLVLPGESEAGLTGLTSVKITSRSHAVRLYEWWVIDQPALMLSMRTDLSGRDLACWCPPVQPCHAGVLLALANGSPA